MKEFTGQKDLGWETLACLDAPLYQTYLGSMLYNKKCTGNDAQLSWRCNGRTCTVKVSLCKSRETLDSGYGKPGSAFLELSWRCNVRTVRFSLCISRELDSGFPSLSSWLFFWLMYSPSQWSLYRKRLSGKFELFSYTWQVFGVLENDFWNVKI